MFRKLHLFLASLLLLSATTANANGTLVGNLYYLFDGTNAIVTYPGDAKPSASGQNEYTGDIVIPATVNYGGTDYTVTEIGEGAFTYSTITTVDIPEGIVTIQKEAFAHSTLTSVVIPNSVTTVKGDAFAYSSALKYVTIGENVDSFSQGFCYSTSVTDVYSNITGTIHSQVAYMFPSKARIHVPLSKVSDYTAKWTSYNIIADYNGVYYAFKGTEATVTYPGNTSDQGADKTAIYYGDIVIPSTITIAEIDYTVTTIGSNAFSHSAITSLDIPNTVTTIEDDAAAYIGATLATVTIGSGVTSISQGFCYESEPTDVYLYTVSVPAGANYMFSGTPTIHVYDFIQPDFENAQYWQDYTYTNDLVADFDALLALATEAQGYLEYVGTTPGYYPMTSYEPINDALANFVQLNPSSPASAINASMFELSNAINAFQASSPNPITPGYYYFKSYYKEKYFMCSDASAATTQGLKVKSISDANPGTDLQCYFKLIKNGDTWYMQSAENGMYVGTLASGSSSTSTGKYVTLTDTPQYTQTITRTGLGLFKIQTIYMDGLTRPLSYVDSKISTQNYSETSEDFKRSQWYVCPVEDEDLFALHMLVEAAAESLNTKTPASHHDNNAPRSFLLGNERTSVDGLATSKDALDALQAAYDAAVAALAEGKEKNDVPDVYNALVAAKAVVDAKSNPLVDGYYHLIAEFGDDTDDTPGGYALQYGYDTANPDNLYKRPYVNTEPKQIFKVEYDAANGKVYLQNIESGKYLGVLNDNIWIFTDTKTALNIMSGKDHNWYWGSPTNDAARSCSFILYDDEAKGISSNNSWYGNAPATAVDNASDPASQAWTISWAFRPADDYAATIETITIGATGYSTFVTDKALVVPAGVTANGVTGYSDTELVLTALTGNVLAANEPVILQGEAGKTYYFIETTETGSNINNNLLQGTGTTGKDVGDNEVYVLYDNNGDAVFRIAAAMTLPAHEAYLPAALFDGHGTNMYYLDEDITGIAPTLNAQSSMFNDIFDLQGRKVTSPKKGQIYIMNGKTVLY